MRCVPCKRASFLLHCRLASSGQCPFSGAPRQTIYCQKVHLYTGWFFNWPQILGVFWALTSTFMPVTVSQCRDATGRCVIVYHLSLPRERRAEEDSGNMLLMHHSITTMVRLQCCQIARSKLGICLPSPRVIQVMYISNDHVSAPRNISNDPGGKMSSHSATVAWEGGCKENCGTSQLHFGQLIT